MSLPRLYYDALIPTGAVARKRPGVRLPSLRSGEWFAVVEPPTVLGERLRTLPGYCWISLGQGVPAHVLRSILEVREAVTPR